MSDVDAALSEANRVLAADGTLVALVVNTRSEYVRSNLQRTGSSFQGMSHRDSRAVTASILEHVDGERELVLGISGETVFGVPIDHRRNRGGRRAASRVTTISLPRFREHRPHD